MFKSPLDYLHYILDECDYVVSVITEDMAKDGLLDDETLIKTSGCQKFGDNRRGDQEGAR